jgi:hypothetical protein
MHRENAVNSHIVSGTNLDGFITALRQSQKQSIDQFLKQRPTFDSIGKYAIANELILRESEEQLTENGRHSWYRELSNFLGNNPADHRLRIITFNYDRSLEQFLFNTLRASTGERAEEVASKINALGIQHVHGQLDGLPWQESDSPSKREYANNPSVANILFASQGIRLTHQASDEVNNPSSPAAAVHAAERVYFLGFGFHDDNLQHLDLPLDHLFEGKFFGASVTKMKQTYVDSLKSRFPEMMLFDTIDSAFEHMVEHGSEWPTTDRDDE